jgi:hypothetical protein
MLFATYLSITHCTGNTFGEIYSLVPVPYIDKNEKQISYSKLKIVFYCIVKQVTYIDTVLLSCFDRILEFL